MRQSALNGAAVQRPFSQPIMRYPFNNIAISAALCLMLAAAAAAEGPSPLCKASLNSLSKLSGAPGESFDMLGVWDDTQGPRTASINRGNSRLLEVLSWSPTIIKVRIPEGLAPGLYRVGVYCNNPPHHQGSGFKDFVVMARSGEVSSAANQPQAQDTQTAPSAKPQTQTGSGSQPLIIMREVPAASSPSAAVPEQPKTSDSNKIDNPVLWIIAILIAAVIVFIIRKKSVVKAADYQNAAETHAQQTYEPKTQTKQFAGRDLPKSFTGECTGVTYCAEILGYDMDDGSSGKGTPIVTVYFSLTKPLSRRLEINARKTRPVLKDNRAEYINALLDMGVNYIDIGFNADLMAAEVPVTKAAVDKALAERIVERLIKLRDLST